MPGRVILVLDETRHPLNAFLESNPDALFWEPESRTIYPSNPNIARIHAACSTIETGRPLSELRRWFPMNLGTTALPAADSKPHQQLTLGGIGPYSRFRALGLDGEEIQVLSATEALVKWHKGAILRDSEGNGYAVSRVDPKAKCAFLEPLDPLLAQSSTYPISAPQECSLRTESFDLERSGLKNLLQSACVGEFSITMQTLAYTLITYGRQEGPDGTPSRSRVSLDEGDLNPAVVFLTRGARFDVKASDLLSCVLAKLPEEALAALRDVLKKSVPVVIQAEPDDVVIRIDRVEGADKNPFFRITLLDWAPGGMGWSEALLEAFPAWLFAASRLLLRCHCENRGCPHCTLTDMKAGVRRALGLALEQTAARHSRGSGPGQSPIRFRPREAG